ncbi:Sortase family protein [Arthrobacter sp. ok909]|nr:Sortase family protein [Arthrobacter sp. ok909]
MVLNEPVGFAQKRPMPVNGQPWCLRAAFRCPRSGARALALLAALSGLAVVMPGCTTGDPRDPQSTAAATSSTYASPSMPAKLAPVVVDGGTNSALPPASPPQRISYPAAGIDVSVLPLTPSTDETATGSLVPPMTMDAYWLTAYGQPGSGSLNTTYIVGHSWQTADAPFNRLSSRSAIGDELSVRTMTGTVKYKVQSVTTHDKATLRTSDVWNKVPGRLVLISCYTKDVQGTNLIVTAMPVP